VADVIAELGGGVGGFSGDGGVIVGSLSFGPDQRGFSGSATEALILVSGAPIFTPSENLLCFNGLQGGEKRFGIDEENSEEVLVLPTQLACFART
jgi:hypothetical protein